MKIRIRKNIQLDENVLTWLKHYTDVCVKGVRQQYQFWSIASQFTPADQMDPPGHFSLYVYRKSNSYIESGGQRASRICMVSFIQL